jgi:hypothetical protein
VYKGPLGWQVVGGHGTYLALAQHRHGRDAGQRPPRRPEALKAEHRPRSALHASVVLLDLVVEPAAAAVPGEAPELALPLHLAQRAGAARQPVGHDGARMAGVLATAGTAEKAMPV